MGIKNDVMAIGVERVLDLLETILFEDMIRKGNKEMEDIFEWGQMALICAENTYNMRKHG